MTRGDAQLRMVPYRGDSLTAVVHFTPVFDAFQKLLYCPQSHEFTL